MPKNNRPNANFALTSIRCVCGYKILLAPNVKKMNDAVETHVAEHWQKISNPGSITAEEERIRDYLITQVFEEASKPQPPI